MRKSTPKRELTCLLYCSNGLARQSPRRHSYRRIPRLNGYLPNPMQSSKSRKIQMATIPKHISPLRPRKRHSRTKRPLKTKPRNSERPQIALRQLEKKCKPQNPAGLSKTTEAPLSFLPRSPRSALDGGIQNRHDITWFETAPCVPLVTSEVRTSAK